MFKNYKKGVINFNKLSVKLNHLDDTQHNKIISAIRIFNVINKYDVFI